MREYVLIGSDLMPGDGNFERDGVVNYDGKVCER